MSQSAIIKRVKTNSVPCTLKMKVSLNDDCVLRVVVINPYRKSAIYYDRQFNAKKDNSFEIRLPQSSKDVDVILICEKGDANIKSVSLKKGGLQQFPTCYKSKKAREFIAFAQTISDRLATLPSGDYFSKNGTFHIQILDSIEGHGTPARIHNDLGVIQVSKEKMSQYTVPRNMAILLHEYSHFYENVIQKDEIEADLNSLRMYFGLGYPVVESQNAFIEVFDHADNPMNRERYEYIFAYATNFKKIKHKICI